MTTEIGAMPTQESPGSQIDRLARFILAEVPGEPSASEGAVDAAIRTITRLQRELGEALSREASLCDFLNSWARESRVEQAELPQDNSKELVDRLWVRMSSRDVLIGDLVAGLQLIEADGRVLELVRIARALLADPRLKEWQ